MKKLDLTFAEGDEPLIKVRVSRRNPTTGKKEPFPLAGITASMVIKPTNAEDDPDAVTYDEDNGAVTYDVPNGIILIQTGIGAGRPVGRRLYLVRMFQGTHPRTLLYGAWRITDL